MFHLFLPFLPGEFGDRLRYRAHVEEGLSLVLILFFGPHVDGGRRANLAIVTESLCHSHLEVVAPDNANHSVAQLDSDERHFPSRRTMLSVQRELRTFVSFHFLTQ